MGAGTVIFNWPIKTTGGDRVVKRDVGFPTINKFASHSLCILIGEMQREAIEKLSKSCQKLFNNFVGWPRLEALDGKLLVGGTTFNEIK